MKSRFLLQILFCTVGIGLAAQATTISVPEIEHFDPYFESNGDLIYGFILKTVARQPGVKLVERKAFGKVLEEQERQKNEGFIDGQTVNQGELVGAQLVLVPTYDQDNDMLNLSLRNLKTGEVSCLHSYPLEEYIPENEPSEKLYDRLGEDIAGCLSSFETVTSATVAEVLEEKSGKARRLLCYIKNTSELRKNEILSVYRLVAKRIGDKQVDYEEAVGVVRINELENTNFFNVTVKSGGKEIAEYLKQNVVLYAK